MKKLLLIAGAVSLVFSAFSWFGYYHVFDGSAELYNRLHQRMIIFWVIGIVLAVVEITSFIIRAKINS